MNPIFETTSPDIGMAIAIWFVVIIDFFVHPLRILFFIIF